MNASLLPLLWFVVIIALIPLVLWLLKRGPLGLGRQSEALKLVAQLPLSPSQRVLLVEVGQGDARQWLVLGATAQHINTLHSLPAQALPAAGPDTPAHAQSFAQQLAQRLSGHTPNDRGGQA
ncbi:flagellar biosynthetic protein FliO [Roseateles sp. BYS180W]|uniref:Flagellar protein n=1 Tax=Roseateles rivi TaxID=3299028 RepID=A0ABW7FV44_9BURK